MKKIVLLLLVLSLMLGLAACNFGKTDTSSNEASDFEVNADEQEFILNATNGVFHTRDCELIADAANGHLIETNASVDEILDSGYLPCEVCHPDAG